MDWCIVDGLHADIEHACLGIGLKLGTYIEDMCSIVVSECIIEIDELRQTLEEALIVLLFWLTPLHLGKSCPTRQ